LMLKTKDNSGNGNGKTHPENVLRERIPPKNDDEILRKMLKRAVNREDAPEGLRELISRKIRQR